MEMSTIRRMQQHAPDVIHNSIPTPGMRMEKISRFKFLLWPGFEPQTSRLAVQHATAKPPRTTIIIMGAAISRFRKNKYLIQHIDINIGGDLRGAGGKGPSKIGGGGRPMHPSPNISRSNVIGCVVKYELNKKNRCHEGMFCFQIEVFRHKRVIIICLHKMVFIVKTDKRQKIRSMTEEKVIRNFSYVKMDIFHKRSFENLVREIFF